MNGQPAKAQTPAERSRSAWNTLSPIARPKRGQLRVTSREPSCSSEIYEVEVTVAPDPTALEPAQSDLGASKGRDLQHIGDQKTTKGRGAEDLLVWSGWGSSVAGETARVWRGGGPPWDAF
ncbi:cyclin-Y-like protein 1 [Cebus imitator]|uniref:cyclin-Y-like protein 1 n=1 Tax=Cebus imitator TaxID=2715852 RepID=UPI0018984754|nr:cyclin-Y-like protein 1 [Cebus imitator]